MHATALMLNVGLLYLIQKHSSFRVTGYKTLFLITCASDIVLAAIMLVSQPVTP